MWRTGSNFNTVFAGFVVNKVALGEVFLRILSVIIPPILHTPVNLPKRHIVYSLIYVSCGAAGHGLLILEVYRSHTTTHHSRLDCSGRVIGSSQRPLPDNTQHSQQTNIHAPGGIRTHDLSRRATADLRLRPHGYWDRPTV